MRECDGEVVLAFGPSDDLPDDQSNADLEFTLTSAECSLALSLKMAEIDTVSPDPRLILLEHQPEGDQLLDLHHRAGDRLFVLDDQADPEGA